jgi:carboxyl-terminal processing protease
MYRSRLKPGLYAVLLLAVLGLASYTMYRRGGGDPIRDGVVLSTLLQGLGIAHYQPEALDDKFSRRVFDLYLKRIDGNKQLLLQPEVAQLRQFQNDIDDEVKRGTHEFLDASSQLITRRQQEIQGLYRELLAQPFDFSVVETWESDPDKATLPPPRPPSAKPGASSSSTRPWPSSRS